MVPPFDVNAAFFSGPLRGNFPGGTKISTGHPYLRDSAVARQLRTSPVGGEPDHS